MENNKKKGNGLVVTIICLLTLAVVILGGYIVYEKVIDKDEPKAENNNEENNDEPKKENNNKEEVNNVKYKDNELLKLFDLSSLTQFETSMLNLLSNNERFKENYFTNWTINNINYIKLDKITYYGKIKGNLIYKLDFKYKCTEPNDYCVFLSTAISGETEEIKENTKSLYLELQKENDNYIISNIDDIHGGSYNQQGENYDNKCNSNVNKILENYINEHYDNYVIKNVKKRDNILLNEHNLVRFYDVEIIDNGVKTNWIAVIEPDSNYNPIISGFDLADNYDIFK